MRSSEGGTQWNPLEPTALASCRKTRLTTCVVTSGVQTGGSLAAVQLPLLDLEVGTGPLQAGVAPQLGEELLHGPLVGRGAAAPSRSPFPYDATAAAASASVPRSRSHHLDPRQKEGQK